MYRIEKDLLNLFPSQERNVSIAIKYVWLKYRTNPLFEDLLSEVALVLVKCFKHRDSSKDTDQFKAYLKLRVDGAIKNYLRKQLPLTRTQLKDIKKEEGTYKAGCGLKENIFLVDRLLSLTPSILDRDSESGTIAYITQHSIENEVMLEDKLLASISAAQVLELAKVVLSPRCFLIYKLYYIHEVKMLSIGNYFKIDESRVSQLIKSSTLKIKEAIRIGLPRKRLKASILESKAATA